jgi:hypothetical protein
VRHYGVVAKVPRVNIRTKRGDVVRIRRGSEQNRRGERSKGSIARQHLTYGRIEIGQETLKVDDGWATVDAIDFAFRIICRVWQVGRLSACSRGRGSSVSPGPDSRRRLVSHRSS